MDGDETKGTAQDSETAAGRSPDASPVDALVHDAVQRILASITPVAVLKPVVESPQVQALDETVAVPVEAEPAADDVVDQAPDAAIAPAVTGDVQAAEGTADEIAAARTVDVDPADMAQEIVGPVPFEQPAVSPSRHEANQALEPAGQRDEAEVNEPVARAEAERDTPAPFVAERPIDAPRTSRSLRDRLRGPWTIGRVARVAGLAVAAYFGAVMLLILLYRFINPPTTTLIAYQWLTGTKIEQTWVPIEDISGNLLRAVVVSEDWGFCDHYGVDLVAIEKALEQAGEGKVARGASTISMQVIKNLFLSQSKSYVRKAVEIPLTIVAEAVWPKSRMLEIYLNIAEWGPGVFGAEAAAQHHFSKPASKLTSREAALLAAALPNPILRDAGDPGTRTARKASVIQSRMRAAGPVADCAMTGRQRSTETGRDEERDPPDGWRTTVKKRAGAGEGL